MQTTASIFSHHTVVGSQATFILTKTKVDTNYKGPSMFLPDNFIYQIYPSELPTLFMVRNFYQSNLQFFPAIKLYYRGSPLSTVSFSTIPNIVQFKIVLNNTNFPVQYSFFAFFSAKNSLSKNSFYLFSSNPCLGNVHK